MYGFKFYGNVMLEDFNKNNNKTPLNFKGS